MSRQNGSVQFYTESSIETVCKEKGTMHTFSLAAHSGQILCTKGHSKRMGFEMGFIYMMHNFLPVTYGPRELLQAPCRKGWIKMYSVKLNQCLGEVGGSGNSLPFRYN